MEQVEPHSIIRVGVLTISDRASRGETEDLSGPAIQAIVQARGFRTSLYACIPDDKKMIRRTLARWADEELCDCIFTTGGTGLGTRDVTPEATARVIERELPALALHIALDGLKQVPTAILSRGIAGTRGRALIINLPGSPGGARHGAELVCPILEHTIAMLHDGGHPAQLEKAQDNADL